MRGTRLWATSTALAAAIIVGVSGSPGTAQAAGETKRELLMLVRTTDGPASFELQASVEPGPDSGAFIGFMGARVEDGRVRSVTPGTQLSHGRTDDPTIYGSEGPVTACRLGGPCGIGSTFAGTLFAWSSDGGGKGVSNRVYIVLEGEDVAHELEADGWKLEEADFSYRYVDNIDSDAIGVAHTGRGVEVLFEAAARGGTSGSVAQAVPPCSQTIVGGVPRGVGTLALGGGAASPEPAATCPRDAQPLVDHAPGATTWRAHGTVAGSSDLAYTHLFVIDVPREKGADDATARPTTEPDRVSDSRTPGSVEGRAGAASPAAVGSAGIAAEGASASAPASASDGPQGCLPSVSARRTGRTVTVRTRSAERCRLTFRLLAGRTLLARGSAVAGPGRTVTTRLRPRAARRASRLAIVAVDAAGNRVSRSIAVR
jgi:hypothetical protein